MRKKQLAIIAISCWLFMISICMLAAQQYDLEIFFILWLIGILIIVILIDSPYFQTAYIKKMKCLIIIGFIIFGYIVVKKILVIINS